MKLLIIIRYCINRKFFLNKIINHYLLYKLNIYYYQRNLSFKLYLKLIIFLIQKNPFPLSPL